MANDRKAIRHAIVAAVTGLTTTGANVFEMHAHPISDSSLPGLNVAIASEEMDPEFSAMGVNEARILTLQIEARAKATNLLADTLDTITAEVEAALIGDASVAALVSDFVYSGCEFEFNDEGDQPVGLVTMEFSVRYSVDRTSP